MPLPYPGIVSDENISRSHRLDRKMIQEEPNRIGHRVHMARRARDSLGQHARAEVEYAGGYVTRFSDDRIEGCANQSLALLLDDGKQAVPHDLLIYLGRLIQS